MLHREFSGSAVWDSTVGPAKAFFLFNDESQRELKSYIKSLRRFKSLKDIERVPVTAEELPAVSGEIDRLKTEVEEGIRFVVTQPLEGLTQIEHLAVPWILACLLGRLYEQNTDGDLLYLVTDKGGRMEEGARYSQTRQGGSFHTDGVNQQKPYDYLVLYSVSSATIGGESILISGFSIYNHLKKHAPKALKLLEKDFIWTFKGLKDEEFYEEPVVKLVDGDPQWRYLRNYMEEAAYKKGTSFSSDTIWAMNTLDATLELSQFHFRYILRPGECIVAKDTQIFHGRTSFSDDPDSISFNTYLKHPNTGGAIKRSCLRLWVENVKK